jgi:hypothetical protein
VLAQSAGQLLLAAILALSALNPSPAKPVLPPSWLGNVTVERASERGDKMEYHGWQYSSSTQCASRTQELGSPMGDHTAIYYYNFGNQSGQCFLQDRKGSAAECRRGFLPMGACPWAPHSLDKSTYNGTATLGARLCYGWRDEAGVIKYVDANNLPCGLIGPDGGKLTYTNVVAIDIPKAVFQCPC